MEEEGFAPACVEDRLHGLGARALLCCILLLFFFAGLQKFMTPSPNETATGLVFIPGKDEEEDSGCTRSLSPTFRSPTAGTSLTLSRSC